MERLNNNWKFIYTWNDGFLNDISCGEDVRLPHNVGEQPLHYAGPERYMAVCGYGRVIEVDESALGKKIFLQFDGAAHIAEVYIGGVLAGTHFGGYTAFRVDITDLVHPGANILTVKLDCTENPAVPPFGFVIDYLTYGGLYRDVWLDIRPETHIKDVFVHTEMNAGVAGCCVIVEAECSAPAELIQAEVFGPDGDPAGRGEASGDEPADGTASGSVASGCKYTLRVPIKEPVLWSPEHPALYRCVVTVKDKDTSDPVETFFGIRDAVFKSDGFYLNGEKYFIRGLNRHQSFPYIGYAAPESLQREDAQILKEELGCNAVRTSHYPQSRYFLDECDRLGLLVFTEIPGWQHLGDGAWKGHAITALEEMIVQYRNHPSIVLWGVRINESVDDDAFYRLTNETAHRLDPTRQTSGVRYLEKSSLLEDVYAFNDFSHNGNTPGCRKKSDITPDMDKGYLISECNGHMFPTKPFDSWPDRQEHALRHARVINAAMSEGNIAGVFGWCMFDYATHEDFGSGDRICYHGVLDSFRNPKLAAYTYASQTDTAPVLEVGSSFDIGEYPAGSKGEVYAFTNADEIRLYKNDRFVKTFSASPFTSLPHGPIPIDDTIGDLITDECFEGKKADIVRELLLSAEKHGFEGMPLKDKLKLLYAHFRYKLSFEQGYALYGKYMGNWGNESVIWRFDAVKDGEVVRSVIKAPGNTLHISAAASNTLLKEGETYDMALVRITIKDENGNIASYAQLPLRLSVCGDIELVGPETVTAEGGMCGTFVRTAGTAGSGTLKIGSEYAGEAVIEFRVK